MESLQSVLGVARDAILFLFILTVLVAVHELGHYLSARMFGMKVDAFAIFMGGIRKTKLDEYLPKPLAPGKYLALLWLGVAAAMIAGFATNKPSVLLAGLAVGTFVAPTWVGLRLETLYHLPKGHAIRTLAMWWGIMFGILVLGTKLQGLQTVQVMSLLFLGSMLAMLFTYYAPVSKKADDSAHGFGQITVQVPDADTGGTKEKDVQVRFRPVWFKTTKSGTEVSLLLLPLGGFCSISGMAPKDDGSETQILGGFYGGSAFSRFITLFAGPAFSMLFGSLLLFLAWTTVGKYDTSDVAELGQMLKDSPAKAVGMLTGDKVVSVDGVPVKTWYDMVSNVRDKVGKQITIDVERDGKPLTFVVTPKSTTQAEPVLKPDLKLDANEKRIQAKLLVAPPVVLKRLPIGQAAIEAIGAPVMAVTSLIDTLRTPGGAKDSVGGPATIAAVTSQAANEGLYAIVMVAAMISISLGIMNLFIPFHPFDGGQMVVAFVEMLRRGKRLSFSVQNTVATVGMFFVVALVLSILALDVNRFMGPKEKPAAQTTSQPAK